MLNQESLVAAAKRIVPSFKWAVAAAALLALSATVIRWGLNLPTLFLVAGVLLVVAVAFIVLQWVSKLDTKKASVMAAFMAWSSLLFLVVALALVLTSAAFDRPWTLKTMINTWILGYKSSIRSTTTSPQGSSETSNSDQHLEGNLAAIGSGGSGTEPTREKQQLDKEEAAQKHLRDISKLLGDWEPVPTADRHYWADYVESEKKGGIHISKVGQNSLHVVGDFDYVASGFGRVYYAHGKFDCTLDHTTISNRLFGLTGAVRGGSDGSGPLSAQEFDLSYSDNDDVLDLSANSLKDSVILFQKVR
jgi:hypothetical protein